MRTAESVTPKHPDKMCDQISDAILDHCLTMDPLARVAIETMGGHGEVIVMGEVTFKAGVMLSVETIEDLVKEIAGENIKVHIKITAQSREIANGVDTGGAGDQGIMVGYACNENDAQIPQEAYLARWLAMELFDVFPYDGKTQVTLDDNDDVVTIVASFQNVEKKTLQEAVYAWIEKNGIQCTPDVLVHANPAGDWKQGGFDADTGLTGRKLMVDNYGPQIPIGGGCFSGKDATKVDRSAAYMARRIAVDLLRKHQAEKVFVNLAYAIGVAEPVMADVRIVGAKNELPTSIEEYDLTPAGIIKHLNLREPQYRQTALWGHFGNEFTWDK